MHHGIEMLKFYQHRSSARRRLLHRLGQNLLVPQVRSRTGCAPLDDGRRAGGEKNSIGFEKKQEPGLAATKSRRWQISSISCYSPHRQISDRAVSC